MMDPSQAQKLQKDLKAESKHLIEEKNMSSEKNTWEVNSNIIYVPQLLDEVQ